MRADQRATKRKNAVVNSPGQGSPAKKAHVAARSETAAARGKGKGRASEAQVRRLEEEEEVEGRGGQSGLREVNDDVFRAVSSRIETRDSDASTSSRLRSSSRHAALSTASNSTATARQRRAPRASPSSVSTATVARAPPACTAILSSETGTAQTVSLIRSAFRLPASLPLSPPLNFTIPFPDLTNLCFTRIEIGGKRCGTVNAGWSPDDTWASESKPSLFATRTKRATRRWVGKAVPNRWILKGRYVVAHEGSIILDGEGEGEGALDEELLRAMACHARDVIPKQKSTKAWAEEVLEDWGFKAKEWDDRVICADGGDDDEGEGTEGKMVVSKQGAKTELSEARRTKREGKRKVRFVVLRCIGWVKQEDYEVWEGKRTGRKKK
ncbi:hypothetical protein JCM11641_000370 [Rhodosporidiobolus odoratus]